MKELSQSDVGTIPVVGLDDAVAYRRNAVVKALRSVLVSSRRILPDSLYNPLYNTSFELYRAALRLMYLRKVVAESFNGTSGTLPKYKTVRQVMPHSLVGSAGLEATFDAAVDVVQRGIPGAFVECGVAQGGCSALMAMVAKADSRPRNMWLFDSFQGLPAPTTADFDNSGKWTGQHVRPLPPGSCLGTKGEVESLLFEKFDLGRNSVFLVEGWFQDTLLKNRDRVGAISLLRIDGDWYESTKCCLHSFYDSITPGGYVIIDDYGVCFGCKRAVHEFLDEKQISPSLVTDGRGGISFVKPS